MTVREVVLTNTLTRKKEPVKTLKPGELTFYSCGPTVYDFIHVGNLRAAMTADLAYRVFKRAGFSVTYVRNYTDVDDRIIAKANKEGVDHTVVSKRYIGEVERDYAASGLLEPSHKTTVTGHIAEIISMIESIIKRGCGYVVDGEVFFAIDKADQYGKLSHRKLDDLEAGHRVEINAAKKNPLDFTLWKPAKPGEPSWQSPWGAGRPGWHIECSAMASKWLGDRIDVHHGGEDLVFPHHENEIAQSEGASGAKPFVGYWIHNAFLTLNKDKMSKSLGNVFNVRECLTQYSGEVARMLLLSAHYRSILDFGADSIEAALVGLQRLYEAKLKAREILGRPRVGSNRQAEEAWGSFAATVQKARDAMDAHAFNDLNTPGIMAEVFGVVREFNRTLAVPLSEATPAVLLGAQALIDLMEKDLGELMGLGRLEPRKALDDLGRIRAAAGGGAAGKPTADEIAQLIQERLDARKNKDFARADAIRKDLAARGVTLKDGPQGTTWEYS